MPNESTYRASSLKSGTIKNKLRMIKELIKKSKMAY
jgi:hypothetical protein